ncbi:MAG: type II secretion system GspH family protein [Candidatus Obscuribacterales bacterium]|nr:type II secretion system GspH family protein [Candidatus Obscuribacterales bacterium]
MNRLDQGGYQLVELMVAIGICTIFLAGILDSMASVMRSSTATQNQVIAAAIAQQVIDHARHCRWNDLTAGNYTLMINRYSAGTNGPTFMNRALLLDSVTNRYANETYNSTTSTKGNVFAGDRASATATITDVNADEKLFVLTVSWPGEHGGGNKSLRAQTSLYHYGINSGHDQ